MWPSKSQPDKPVEANQRPLYTAWPFTDKEWFDGWRFGIHEIEPGLGIGSRLMVLAKGRHVRLDLQLSICRYVEYEPGKFAWQEQAYFNVPPSEVSLSEWPSLEILTTYVYEHLSKEEETNDS